MARTKDEYLQYLRDEEVKWQTFLDEVQVRFEAMPHDAPNPSDEWTLKDLIAHMTTWWQIDRAEIKAGCGQSSAHHMPWPAEYHWNTHKDQDDINDWIYKQNHNRPWQAVLMDARKIIRQMIETMETRTDTELLDPNCFEWLHGRPMTEFDFLTHWHEEHRSDIQRLMAANQS